MGLNDIWSVQDRQTYLGEEVLNIWYFQQVDANANRFDLFNGFRDSYVNVITDLQVTQLEHTGQYILNETDGNTFYEANYGTPIAGALIGSPMPSFNAWAYQLTRTNRQTRNGAKRFAGVREEDTSGNNPDAAFETVLASVGGQLAGGISESGVLQFVPVIYRPADAVSPGSPEVINPVTAVDFKRLSTQNTRKA